MPIDKPDADGVTPEFLENSSRAAIKALRGLEQTAIMLEKWAPECFPEVTADGKKHFARVMMEAAAEEIRKSWASAIADVSNKQRASEIVENERLCRIIESIKVYVLPPDAPFETEADKRNAIYDRIVEILYPKAAEVVS